MKEIDKFRGRKNTIKLTKEQIKFIKQCRSGIPVPYKRMSELWDKLGWGKANEWNMQRLYERLVKEGQIK
jgi:hypothetical protein